MHIHLKMIDWYDRAKMAKSNFLSIHRVSMALIFIASAVMSSVSSAGVIGYSNDNTNLYRIDITSATHILIGVL